MFSIDNEKMFTGFKIHINLISLHIPMHHAPYNK